MKIQLSRDVEMPGLEILGSKDPTKDVDMIGSEDPWIPGCRHSRIHGSVDVEIMRSVDPKM